jgi:hypothetical protein
MYNAKRKKMLLDGSGNHGIFFQKYLLLSTFMLVNGFKKVIRFFNLILIWSSQIRKDSKSTRKLACIEPTTRIE